jgi:hypothetical protein
VHAALGGFHCAGHNMKAPATYKQNLTSTL